MYLHGNQHPSSIKYPFISLYFKYHPFMFICFLNMNSPVFPSLDDIYCTSHCGSWEPPGRFLDYCKFLFSFVQSLYAGIKIQVLKNISRSRFWKKSKINNFTSHFSHKIHCVGKKYFLTAYLNSWCYLLSFDRLHYIFL